MYIKDDADRAQLFAGLLIDRIEMDRVKDRMITYYNVEEQKARGVLNPLISTERLIPRSITITHSEA